MLRLSEIMTEKVVSVTPETTLRDAVELFSARHVSGAPVVNGPELVGVISATDIMSFAASMPESDDEGADAATWNEMNDAGADEQPENENIAPGSYFTDLFCDASSDVMDRMRSTRGPEWNFLDEHTVDEVMTRPPIVLAPNDPVIEAAELMNRNSIHRVLVVENGTIVGIVSALDVARAVAEHKLVARTYVFNRNGDF